jgi:hypothetical protein
MSARLTWILWAGILAGPLAFALNLQTNYMLVDLACDRNSRGVLHIVPAVVFLFIAGAAVLSWNAFRGLEAAAASSGPALRAKFMALLGVLSNVLFILLVVSQWIPIFTLHPCQR